MTEPTSPVESTRRVVLRWPFKPDAATPLAEVKAAWEAWITELYVQGCPDDANVSLVVDRFALGIQDLNVHWDAKDDVRRDEPDTEPTEGCDEPTIKPEDPRQPWFRENQELKKALEDCALAIAFQYGGCTPGPDEPIEDHRMVEAMNGAYRALNADGGRLLR